MTVAEIAERTALSAAPVSRRLKRLEDEGVIRGYAPILDARKLGFELDAYVLINLQAHNDENMAAASSAKCSPIPMSSPATQSAAT